ncbi:MAG: glycosyltransferase family 2 protein [Flavitalea sp.]
MINGKTIVVCLPAYNAAKTLEKTYGEIPVDIVDEVILVDDASGDETLLIARRLGIRHIVEHNYNKGYGGNQKSCYAKALELDADIIIMLHPDYQYNPRLIPSMAYLIAHDVYPVVLGSRILGKGAMRNGMPFYKYFSNRMLTFIQNIMLHQKLSEYHTGYRAYSASALASINLSANSDDFIFDNQVLAQFIYAGFQIGEISCPAKYFSEASSINFSRSVVYGWGVLITSIKYRLNKAGLLISEMFKNSGEKS